MDYSKIIKSVEVRQILFISSYKNQKIVSDRGIIFGVKLHKTCTDIYLSKNYRGSYEIVPFWIITKKSALVCRVLYEKYVTVLKLLKV